MNNNNNNNNNNSMGQNDEESAELLATMQHSHVAMKKFYNESTSPSVLSLRETYGPTYPSLWREVIDWKGWKDARKAFLKHESQIESGSVVVSSDNTAAAAAPRKRKSRWATAAPTATDSTTSNSTNNNTNPPTKRKSRWARGRDPTPKPINGTIAIPNSSSSSLPLPLSLSSNPSIPSALPASLLPNMPTNLNPTDAAELSKLQLQLRQANEKLQNLETQAAKIDALPKHHPDRSPSPPPIYTPDGKRKNTRAVRWRETYTALRLESLEKILTLTSKHTKTDPNALAPSLFHRKRTKKIPIPIDDHPTYNFIGLIIGPRGKTQKELESKTGCKIAIRGKGSVKEGARGRRDGKVLEGDTEKLHVVVTGESQSAVDAAADMIHQMLVVIDDDKNVHKQQQLRELALLNGTLKEEEYCSLCAEKGHRAFECPKRFGMKTGGKVEVKCAICGDTSHPTRDCIKNKGDGVHVVGLAGENKVEKKDEQQLDSDYLAFMNELDGKPADANTTGGGGGTTTGAVDRKSVVQTISNSNTGPVCIPAPPLPGSSAVTTISNSKTTAAAANAAGGSSTTSGTTTPAVRNTSSVITTISSRVIKASEVAPADPIPPPSTTTTTTSSTITSIPATTITNAGITTSTLPPPPLPPTSSTTISTTLPPPTASTAVPPPPTMGLAPPPPPIPSNNNTVSGSTTTSSNVISRPPTTAGGSVLPPPLPVGGSANSNTTSYPPPQQQQQQYYNQQQHYGNNYNNGYGYQQQQQQYYNNNNNNGGQYHNPQQQQQQHPQQQNNNNGGWDYRSYYGTGASANNDAGAGGFNWWET